MTSVGRILFYSIKLTHASGTIEHMDSNHYLYSGSAYLLNRARQYARSSSSRAVSRQELKFAVWQPNSAVNNNQQTLHGFQQYRLAPRSAHYG